MRNGFHVLYVRKGKVIIPVKADTTSGWLDIDPVNVFDCNDVEAMSQAIRGAIISGNPKGRGYLRNEFPPPVVLKPTKTRSWSQFSKGTTSIGWVLSDEQCTIDKIVDMGVPGKAGYEPIIVSTLPRNVDLGTFVEAILCEVRNACVGTNPP